MLVTRSPFSSTPAPTWLLSWRNCSTGRKGTKLLYIMKDFLPRSGIISIIGYGLVVKRFGAAHLNTYNEIAKPKKIRTSSMSRYAMTNISSDSYVTVNHATKTIAKSRLLLSSLSFPPPFLSSQISLLFLPLQRLHHLPLPGNEHLHSRSPASLAVRPCHHHSLHDSQVTMYDHNHCR